MKRMNLRTLIFMALCCDLGLFSKKLISPLSNLITDSLHIPGGVATAFSLMFLVIAAGLISGPGCGTIMAAVQSALALGFGMVGSMGALSPLGYLVPGMVIDLTLWVTGQLKLSPEDRMFFANIMAAVSASLTANLIVFRLHGMVLVLYLCVSAFSGALCGKLAGALYKKLCPVIGVTLKKSANQVKRGGIQ